MKTYTLTEVEKVANDYSEWLQLNNYRTKGMDEACRQTFFQRFLSTYNFTEEVGIKEDDFCKIYTSYYGEEIDNLKQLTIHNFSGHELLEFINYVISQKHPQPSASLASHSCTIGNSIQHDLKVTIEFDEEKEIESGDLLYFNQHSGLPTIYRHQGRKGENWNDWFNSKTGEQCYKKIKSIHIQGLLLRTFTYVDAKYLLLNSGLNVKVSDTTEADSSNEDHQIKISELREKFFNECVKDKEDWFEENFKREPEEVFEWFKPYLKIPSIDWEGLESACEYWCHREFNESPPPVKVMEWLKTNLQDYIK